jgi:hypothetical protein
MRVGARFEFLAARIPGGFRFNKRRHRNRESQVEYGITGVAFLAARKRLQSMAFPSASENSAVIGSPDDPTHPI